MTDADIKKLEEKIRAQLTSEGPVEDGAVITLIDPEIVLVVLVRLKKAGKERDEARRSKAHQKSKAGYADRARRDNAAGIDHWKQMYDAVIEQSREDHSFHCAEADRLKTEIITLQADLADARHGWERAAETIRELEERVRTSERESARHRHEITCLMKDIGNLIAVRDSARAEGVAEERERVTAILRSHPTNVVGMAYVEQLIYAIRSA